MKLIKFARSAEEGPPKRVLICGRPALPGTWRRGAGGLSVPGHDLFGLRGHDDAGADALQAADDDAVAFVQAAFDDPRALDGLARVTGR